MPGEQGRVVLTVLSNFATPLLRYEIGDIAVPGAPCACGRGLPVIERVAGRVRNMMTLPGGERRFPAFDSGFYGELGPVRQYQIVQKTRERLELHVVAERALTADEEAAIKRRLLDRLQQEFEVEFVRRDAIPRGPGGKYEEFMSEVPPPDAPVTTG
jgi:phenylacetate-CoA ligase